MSAMPTELKQAFAEVSQLLQSAHFAARRLDDELHSGPDRRLADQIHSLRRLLEDLAVRAAAARS